MIDSEQDIRESRSIDRSSEPASEGCTEAERMGLFAFLASFAYSYRQAQLLLGIVYWVVIGPRWFTTVYSHFRNGKHGRRFPWRRVLATEAVPLVTVIAASYLIWWLMEQATVPYAGFQRRDRIVTFIIERHWNSSLVPGSVGVDFCCFFFFFFFCVCVTSCGSCL